MLNSGIEAACAIDLAKEDVYLVVARMWRREIRKNCGENHWTSNYFGRHFGRCCDFDQNDWDTRYEHRRYSINNIGFGKQAALETANTMDDYDAVMATNLRVVVEISQLELPQLISKKETSWICPAGVLFVN